MKITKLISVSIGFIFAALLLVECQKDDSFIMDEASLEIRKADPTTEGNNLSFPVIWSDGYEKVLREPPVPGEVLLDGEWSYVWGENPVEPTDPVYSCKPNPQDSTLCEDGSVPGDGSSTVYKSYLQKVLGNIWQADNFTVSEPLNVDLIDWGDNLESIDWSLRSQIRAEVVLMEKLELPVVEYAMRQIDGWGKTEMHGLQTNLNDEPLYGPGNLATVYSHNARFTIQKMNVHPDSIAPGDVQWIPKEGWVDVNPTISKSQIFNTPIFNMAVYEAGDGPGYYNAEINIKGKIIYGYTWNVRKNHEDIGFYRLTFSFDESGGVVPLNTFFDEMTEIIVPIEEDEPGGGGGGVAIIDLENNLTYMDIKIINSLGGGHGGSGGGGGGGGGGTGGGGGGNGGGGNGGG